MSRLNKTMRKYNLTDEDHDKLLIIARDIQYDLMHYWQMFKFPMSIKVLSNYKRRFPKNMNQRTVMHALQDLQAVYALPTPDEHILLYPPKEFNKLTEDDFLEHMRIHDEKVRLRKGMRRKENNE